MHSQQHPDPELLDQLRAGLLDDQAAVKAALENHIGQCTSCQTLMNSWQQLGPAALGPAVDPESTRRALLQTRRQALRDAGNRHRRSFVPYATAALLLIAISAGFWIARPGFQDTPLVTADYGSDVPDLYEDIEFYLWLAEQDGSAGKSEPANPNST